MSASGSFQPPELAPGRVAVTGSSGFLGRATVRALREGGHAVLRVVRGATSGDDEISWDPAAGTIERERLEGLDAVVHLAGEPIGERWSAERKRRIRDSRVRGTTLLAETLASLERPPRVLVSASAVGYYGDRGDEPLDEESAPGDDFLARVTQEWEAASRPAEAAGVRVANPRFGLVLGAGGGALERMITVFRAGGGGVLGSGEQWWSWVALDDAVDAVRLLLATEWLRGPVNVVAPEPVRNEEFTRDLAHALHRPALLKVPAVALRLAFGEMADATLLASQRVVPERLLGAGFRFRHPDLPSALRAALDGSG